MSRQSRLGTRLRTIRKPSPALLIAMAALFMSTAGTGVAAKGLITGRDVADNSLTGKDVRNKTLTPKDFKGSVKGAKGVPGAVGAAGARGDTGAQGAKGDTGLKGDTGDEGPKGDTGDEGPPGPSTGPAGGDLTGSYPNPQIAPGAVGIAENATSSRFIWHFDPNVSSGTFEFHGLRLQVTCTGAPGPADVELIATTAFGASTIASTIGEDDNSFQTNETRAMMSEADTGVAGTLVYRQGFTGPVVRFTWNSFENTPSFGCVGGGLATVG
jgi:hypothetical protein